jgi:hypothetical protein
MTLETMLKMVPRETALRRMPSLPPHPSRKPPFRVRPGGLAIAAALLLATAGGAAAASKFKRTAIYMEQNIQDEDAEVKFDVVAGAAGLSALRVVAPDGRTVLDFKTPESKLGMRHYSLESPEPRNDGKLQADFPEGTYKFTGTAPNGDTLTGEAVLSHKFPDAASLVRPRRDEKNVPPNGLQIRWNPVKDVASLIVSVEHEETGHEIIAKLPGSATSFTVPAGFLSANTSYKLAIGTVSKVGNSTFIESGFTTAARKSAP